MRYPWAAFPFLRYVCFFAVGILLQKYFEWPLLPVASLFTISASSFGLLHLLTSDKRTALVHTLLGAFALLTLMHAGILTSYLHNDLNRATHFSYQKINSRTVYRLRVADDPVLKGKFIRVKADVLAYKKGKKWQEVSGQCQIYFLNAPSALQVRYGTVLLAKGSMQAVPGPLNPDDFDYAKYLSYQNIYQQIYLREGVFTIVEEAPESMVRALAYRFRNHAEDIIVRYVEQPREFAITSALVLGIKDHLDNPLRSAYAEAGATHLLAVSGLHVGLIYGMILLIFSIYNKGRKSFSIPFAGFILAILWFYAFVTGLSPSVLRAVTMFSIMVIANTIYRNGNIFNTLSLSAFILLCFNPNLLFEVGFQLSYAAVAGILFLQPRLVKLIYFESKAMKWTWEVLTVTAAAQIATAPFSIFYFNQFPVYFLATNLFAIPLATAALYSGVALATFGSMHWAGIVIGKINFWLVWCMNELILLEQRLPFAAVKQISMSKPEVLLMYVFLVLLCAFLFYKQLKWLKYSAIAAVLFAVTRSYYFWSATQQKKWIVYHIPGHRALSVIDGRKAVFLLSDELYSNKLKQHYHFSRHWTNLRLSEVNILPLSLPQDGAGHLQVNMLPPNVSVLLLHKGAPDIASADYVVADVAHSRAIRHSLDGKRWILEGNKNLPKWLKDNTAGKDNIWVMRERGAYIETY